MRRERPFYSNRHFYAVFVLLLVAVDSYRSNKKTMLTYSSSNLLLLLLCNSTTNNCGNMTMRHPNTTQHHQLIFLIPSLCSSPILCELWTHSTNLYHHHWTSTERDILDPWFPIPVSCGRNLYAKAYPESWGNALCEKGQVL